MDRKERLRAQLEANISLEKVYDFEQIDRDPSKLRVFGRKVMDGLKIKSEKSEERRDREAMAVVLREYREEKEERRLRQVEEERLRAEEETRQREEQERIDEMDREIERQKLENDMSEARTKFEKRKQEKFEGQRVQEYLERRLNIELTTVEDLEEAVIAEEEGVGKRSIEYEGEEIVVYDLTGRPFQMITHAIDYRRLEAHESGSKTAQELLEHPEAWERTREEAEASGRFGKYGVDAIGDIISVSYVNSEKNINAKPKRKIYYGFERVRPDSLLYAETGDAGVPNTGGKGENLFTKDSINVIEKLENSPNKLNYNEVVLRRYDENGEPLRPSYIICEDGNITDVMLKHAKYFGIPIVNIEREPYEERLEKQAEEAIDTVSEESSYDDICKVIDILQRSPRCYRKFSRIEEFGRGRDFAIIEAKKERAEPGSLEEKIVRLEELELEKRLDVIEEALKAGRAPGAPAPEGFASFNASRFDSAEKNLGSCNWLSIKYRRSGESSSVSIDIFDGENIVGGEELVRSGRLTQEELDSGDSTVYNRLAPLVKEYEHQFLKKR